MLSKWTQGNIGFRVYSFLLKLSCNVQTSKAIMLITDNAQLWNYGEPSTKSVTNTALMKENN